MMAAFHPIFFFENGELSLQIEAAVESKTEGLRRVSTGRLFFRLVCVTAKEFDETRVPDTQAFETVEEAKAAAAVFLAQPIAGIYGDVKRAVCAAYQGVDTNPHAGLSQQEIEGLYSD